jgi:hypothetical protein
LVGENKREGQTYNIGPGVVEIDVERAEVSD